MQHRKRPKPKPFRRRKPPKLYPVNTKVYERAYRERMRADRIASGDRLRLLGVDSYEAYLRSEHWAAVKRLYRASERPQACFVCGDENFDLHHRTYTRLGRERLDDLCPLCRSCHDEAHELEGVSIRNAPEVLKARTQA